jgi:hypothetical protein
LFLSTKAFIKSSYACNDQQFTIFSEQQTIIGFKIAVSWADTTPCKYMSQLSKYYNHIGEKDTCLEQAHTLAKDLLR